MLALTKYICVLAVFVFSAYLTQNANDGAHLRANTPPVTNTQRASPFLETVHYSRFLSDDGHHNETSGGDNSTEPHTDDEHPSTGHEGGHPSLFEATSAIHVETGTYAVLVIIGFIILLKQIIEALYAFTHESPFHGMVKKIEEELMIVGSSSFIFKVVMNTTTFASNAWAYPLEFGEVLIPLVAFSYCGIGIFLIMCSFKQCYTWSKAHNLKLMEILDDYYTASKTWFFRLSWKPMNTSIEQMEFRIFHNIFCSTFKIQKEAFAFDEYVAKVFQRSVLELIEIRLLDWFYVTCLLLLNLARVKLHLNLNSCSTNHDLECDNKRTVRLFTLAGAIIFLFTFFLLIASRRLELTIMSKNGPKDHKDYARYLRAEEEKQQVVVASQQAQMMNKDQLKVAAAKAKESSGAEGGGGHGGGARSTIANLSSKLSRASFTTAQLSHLSSFRSGKGTILEKRSGPTVIGGTSVGSAASGSNSGIHGSSSSIGGEGGSVRGLSTITGVNVIGSSNKVAPFDDTNDKVYSKSGDSGEGKEVGEVLSIRTSGDGVYSGGAGADSPVPVDGSVELIPLLTHNNTTTTTSDTTTAAIPATTSAQALRPSLMLKNNNNNNNPGSDEDSVSSDDLEEEGFGELGMSTGNNNNRGSVSVGGSSGGGSVDYTALKDNSPREAERTIEVETATPILRTGHSAHIRPSQIHAIQDLTFGEHSIEAKEMFWFGKPELHFESVQILFMVISLYAALWLTVIVSLNNSEWRFLSVAPAILILVFFFYIVKTAALLKAVYVVDTDALLEVIEETEAAKQLSLELRDRVLERLELAGSDPFEEIQRLYNEIDVDRNDSLSRSEFGSFMELMGISFSVKKWEKIFKEIDRNYDNEISLNEFLLFLYPDHDVALSQENKRLKVISQRVMDRAQNIMHALAPLSEIMHIGERPGVSRGNSLSRSNSTNNPHNNTPTSSNPNNNSATTSPTVNHFSKSSAAAARRASIPKIHPVMTRQSSNPNPNPSTNPIANPCNINSPNTSTITGGASPARNNTGGDSDGSGHV